MKIDEITRTRRQTDIKFDEPAAGAGPVARAQHHNVDQARPGPKRRVRMKMPDVSIGMPTGEIDDVVSDDQARANAAGAPEFSIRTPGYGAATPPPPNPDNLPATISTGLRAMPGEHDLPDFDPNWLKVKHLPGMMLRQIRAVGRQVFGQFTDYPLEEIEMMSTITHPDADVKRVMKWVSVNGIKDDEASIDLEQTFRGYGAADVQLWRTEKADYLIMRDLGGHYVYTWPGGRGGRLNDPKRLRIDHAR